MNVSLSKRKQNNKKGGILFWIFPVILIIVIAFIIMGVRTKIIQNRIGKPDIVYANYSGRVETIHVKKGDLVKKGQEICSYMVTDESGGVGDVEEDEDNIYVTVKSLKGEVFWDSVELPGIVQPYLSCDVSAQVGGKIVKRFVNTGDTVKKGDRIAEIEKHDYEIALTQAQASFDLSKIQYERVKKLVKAKATSTSDYDKASAGYRNSKAVLENAKLALSRCTVIAPTDGIVNERMFEEGEIISPGKKIAVIIDISKVKMSVGVPEQDVDNVRSLKEIWFTVPALNNKRFKGIVSHLGLSTAPMAKIYPLEVDVENADLEILPGMIAKADVVRKKYSNAVLLPIFDVIPGDNEYYTFVHENGKARRRKIELGSFTEKRVHVISGLKPGDEVIKKGLRLVEDGTEIQVVE